MFSFKFIDSLVEKFQLIPLLFVIFLGSLFLLYINNDILNFFKLVDFRDNYKQWISLTFIFSLICLLVIGIKSFLDFILKKNNKKSTDLIKKEALNKQLHKLTPDEKAYLLPYIINQETTIYFDFSDGIKGSLVGKKIIYRASDLGQPLSFTFPYNLQPWARDYLNGNKHLLNGASDKKPKTGLF